IHGGEYVVQILPLFRTDSLCHFSLVCVVHHQPDGCNNDKEENGWYKNNITHSSFSWLCEYERAFIVENLLFHFLFNSLEFFVDFVIFRQLINLTGQALASYIHRFNMSFQFVHATLERFELGESIVYAALVNVTFYLVA